MTARQPMIRITCYKCKEVFCLTESTYETLVRQAEAGRFFCPHGHEQQFRSGPTELDILRDERDKLKQDGARLHDQIRLERERAEGAERSASAYKGVSTRIRNRIKRGACPCCNRTFQNLASHMATKHPGYVNEEESEHKTGGGGA